jgi:hypothetical protein
VTDCNICERALVCPVCVNRSSGHGRYNCGTCPKLQGSFDIRVIEPPGSRKNMPEADKAKILKILEMSFEEYFKEGAP